MREEFFADFTRRFSRGAVIQARLGHSLDHFRISALFGPSGCGKTTILRCLAGLDRPQEGIIRFGNETWFDSDRHIFLPPQKRKIGYLFQEYALFPHLNVEENIGYGLAKVTAAERRRRIAEMLDFTQMNGYEEYYPRQLSGGQQQR